MRLPRACVLREDLAGLGLGVGRLSGQAATTDSELEGFVQLPALRAAGAVHVGVVGIDEVAVLAAEDAVFAGSRLETAAALFHIERHGGQRPQERGHVGENEQVSAHGVSPSPVGSRWWGKEAR